jgi:cob(I)alamin adenosyltransferase
MSVIINRVYTGVGDRGTTRLAGGQEVPKTDARIEAYGTIDELNAALGICAEQLKIEAQDESDRTLLTQLRRIQNELFDLGGELAVLEQDRHPQQQLITAEDATRLEQEIDLANASLPTLRSFILPGGGLLAAFFHQARTIARRAERRLVALHQESPQRTEALIYLNRLSDWLFVLGRAVATRRGHGEVLWKPGAR